MAPFILNVSNKWEWTASRPGSTTTVESGPRDPLNGRMGGPQSRSGRLREMKISLALSGKRYTFLLSPSPHTNITILTELSRSSSNNAFLSWVETPEVRMVFRDWSPYIWLRLPSFWRTFLFPFSRELFYHEVRGSTILLTAGKHLLNYTASRPARLRKTARTSRKQDFKY